MRFIPYALLIVTALGQPTASADLLAEVQLVNTTGRDKSDWPIFLTVYKVFGSNLDLQAIHPDGFHVYDPNGDERPHMVRRIPPDFSIGNDEIIFVVPKMRAGETLTFRVSNTRQPAAPHSIELWDNPHNLLRKAPLDGTSQKATGGSVQFAVDSQMRHNGQSSVRLTLPVGAAVTIAPGDASPPVQFRKDGLYHFSFWAKTDNIAYNGWGFWNEGVSIAFDPPAFRGRDSIALRGTRDWYCYTFDPGPSDDWGVPAMTSVTQSQMVRKQGKDVPAQIWQKDGRAALTIRAKQANQPFLKGDKTGRLWLSEILLFEQPAICVDRAKGLAQAAADRAIVFARPVNMPRLGVFPHEPADRIDTFAMPGERRTIRFGIHAVEPLKDVRIEVSALEGPSLTLSGGQLDLESLGEYVEDYRPLAQLAPGKAAEYLLGMDVPATAPAGTYQGTVTFLAAGKQIRRVPLTLEVLPLKAPVEGYWAGGIYNTGMGLARDKALYECYAKTGFNCILLFDYLFRYKDGELDFEGAQKQVEEITKIAKVTGGIGLYREPNMSEDQPRLWYQIAAGRPEYQGTYKIGTRPPFRESYQKLARQAFEHAQKQHWPPLLFMVSDEPSDKRDVDASMGWLKQAIPEAMTIADVQFRDMVATWQWYSLPVFDDPIDWTGPFIYEYTRAQGHPFYGFCGTGWALDVARYQPGLMLASSGAVYWHFWHLKGPFEPRNGKVVRSHAVAAMAEGLNDYRYYILLKQQIAKIRKSIREGRLTGVRAGRAAAHMVVAEKYLDSIFSFASADHDRHLMPYNGVPETWGNDRFYDDWRTRMKDYLMQMQDKSAPNAL